MTVYIGEYKTIDRNVPAVDFIADEYEGNITIHGFEEMAEDIKQEIRAEIKDAIWIFNQGVSSPFNTEIKYKLNT